MSFITIDFETYYDNECGFKKQTTEEYVRDDRFQVIGVGIKVDDNEPEWIAGTPSAIEQRFHSIDWKDSAVLCHNALFDVAILSWRYNIEPGFIFDTLCMGRAVDGVDAGGSLAAMAKRYALGEKGTEVVNAFGKRLADFSADELARYGEYCINDVELTHALFLKLAPHFNHSEFALVDMTIRMFTQPTLHLNDALMVDRLEHIRAQKKQLLGTLMERLSCADEESVRKKLASNPQFAQLLRDAGVEPPMKTSPTTGKPTYALAKNDEGFIALTEHDDPHIQQLCAVRLGTKSTLEESRIERFIGIGARNKGRLPIPLRYYGAHTGRWSGSDGVNLQNLPSRDKDKKALKNAIEPPEGFTIINCDSSQIEARVLAWWAGQDDVVSQFANGEDVYSVFASKIYGRAISKKDPVERFVGKTCILGLGYGTGAEKLRHTLKTSPPGADLPIETCKSYVDTYRNVNYAIVDLWRECDQALQAMLQGGTARFSLGRHGTVWVDEKGIRLPNGLYIRYPGLRMEEGKMVYSSRRGTVNVWGGVVVENVVQALARIVVGEQMVALYDLGLRPVLTVHDAAVLLVPDEHTDEGVALITQVMSTAPDWADGLPVACEAKAGKSYGAC